LEIVVAIFVLAVMVSVGALTFQSTVTRERSKGLAHTLAAELRAARATALQSEKFVAVCLPNDGSSNPFSRSFAVRAGYDRGDLVRTVNFDDDLSATVFTGRWAGDTLETFRELPSWLDDAEDEYRLVFRPDGTALSEDLAQKDGKYQFVVSSSMEASGEKLTAATSPTTIWVSKAGTVGVMESTLPAGELPKTGRVPTAARLSPASTNNENKDPVVTAVDFLPIEVEDLEDVGLGQTAVQIHPQQKLQGMGQNGIEYGLTTFRFRAKDADGGPLRFQVEVESSVGEAGNFSFQESASALGPTTGGQMDFVQTESGDWVWESVISWRPPPGARMGTVYDFTLKVEDPQGNLVETESGGDLIPRMALLRPENIVYETDDKQLTMTNLDGTSHRKLTLTEVDEFDPFFSSDGTRLYSFYDSPTELAIITRNADGTNRKRLRSFPHSYFRKLTFDPFKNYAAYLTGSSETFDVEYQEEKSRQVVIEIDDPANPGEKIQKTVTVYYLVDGSSPISINKLEVMHLNSGKKVTVSDHAEENFKWYGTPRFGLAYTENDIYDDDDRVAASAQDPDALAQGVAENLSDYIPSPGYERKRQEVVIRDYPPRPEATNLPNLSDGHQSEVFNLARPRYYVELKSTAPCLTFYDSTGALATRVLVNPSVKSPSWSSNGRDVLYARESGSAVNICKQTVLNASLDAFEMSGEEVLYSASGVSQPLLSSSGDYAFFVKSGDIMRLDLSGRGSPVNLTENLERKVLSYVLSP
jgi:hypothetical protein